MRWIRQARLAMKKRPGRGRAELLGVLLVPLWLCAAAPADATTGAARAYYYFSLAQQAQFQHNLSDAIGFLEEAVHSKDSSDLRLELAELYASMNRGEQAEAQAREAVRLDPANREARKALADILVDRGREAEDAEKLEESERLYSVLVGEAEVEESSALSLAELQAGRGDLGAAASTLETFQASHPSTPALDLELARVYQRSGRTEEAIARLRQVGEKDPDNREAKELLADLLEESGRGEEAVRVLREIVNDTPTRPYSHYRLGTALIALGKYPEAETELMTALQSDPRNIRVLIALAQSAQGMGKPDQAEDYLRRALSRDPDSLEVQFWMGRLRQSRGDDQGAMEFYSRIISRTANGEGPTDQAFFSLASFQAGVIRYLQRDYPAAVRFLEQARQSTEHSGEEVETLLIRTYIAAGRLEDADRILAEDEPRFPNSVSLPALSAQLLLRRGKTEEAQRRFREMVDREKGSEEVYLEVLQVWARENRYPEAQPWMEEARKSHPDSRKLEFQAAALVERLGRFREAEKLFRGLIQKDPEDAEALNYLGYMLADSGVKLKDARRLLEKAVSLDPENVAYLDSLGWVCYRQKQYDQAEGHLRKAVQGSRNDPTILEHLGDVLAARGQVDEALKVYRLALEQEPEKPEELQRKIRKLEPSGSKP